MKILLLGKNGQLGRELNPSLEMLGEVVALGRTGKNDYCGDVTDEKAIERTVRAIAPDIIVNATAFTDVDAAEKDPSQAYAVNARALETLSELARTLHIHLIHYSTDYVFDGLSSHPWQEGDPENPLNVYGASKLLGEQAIVASGCNYSIFRTSWVYGLYGSNFIKTILKLAMQKKELRIVNDQVGSPTGTDILEHVTTFAIRELAAERQINGIYHVAAAGSTSWFEYANYIVNKSHSLGLLPNHSPLLLSGVSSEEYGSTVQRPRNSRLSTHRIEERLNIRFPDWSSGVDRYLNILSSIR